MKHFVTPALFLLISITSLGQKSKKNDVFYLWDSAWNNVPKFENASFFTRVRYINDTCWQHYNYKIGGPLITFEEYKDREGKIAHGRFSYMRSDGTLDSIGNVLDGKLNGTWYFFSDTASVIMKKEYSRGRLLSVWKASDAIDPRKDSSSENTEIESKFSGEPGSWAKYLVRNMKYPESAASKEIQGTVIVNFMIDAQGMTQDQFLSKSVEFTLDDEALRLIKQSPAWIPAMKNGRKVKSYKSQPIEFRLQ
jgi:periplasmic protein TonB